VGTLIGVAVGFFVGAKAGSGSLSSVKTAVSGLASSGDINKVLSGAMAGAMPMAGQLLRTGRVALEGIRRG
jgi:hypothetical protein